MALSIQGYGQVTETVETVLETATQVDEVSGGYTLVVVLLVAMVIAEGGVIWIVNKQSNKKIDEKDVLIQGKDEHIMNISKEAVGAVVGMKGVLDSIKDSQDRLSDDHDKIKDGISEIKINVKQ